MYVDEKWQGTILFLTINRPERCNAIGPLIATSLLEKLTKLAKLVREQPDSVHAVCLDADSVNSSSGKVWVAGGDLHELAVLDQAGAESYIATMHQVCLNLESLPIPVAAFIDGQAIGGGAELAMAADLRIATTRSTLHFKQLAVGLPMGYLGSQRLVRLVGLAKAQELLYLQRKLSATEAINLGLFHSLIDPDQQNQPTVIDLLSPLTKNSEAFIAQKSMFRASQAYHHQYNIDFERNAFVEVWKNPSHRRFLEAYLRKSKEPE